MEKYFVIGFNKTATLTFHELFLKNDLSSYHDGDSKYKGLVSRDNINWNTDSHTCFSDNGNYQDFKLLDTKYPNSIFILNIRRLDQWLVSIFKHGLRGNFEWAVPCTINKCTYKIKEREEFHRLLLDYFKDKPHKLIIVSIDEENWIQYICSELNFKNANIESQHIFPTEESPEHQNIINIVNQTFNTLSYSKEDGQNILFKDMNLTNTYLNIFKNNIPNAPENNLTKKYFVIGFDKTATCTFHELFLENGLTSQHAKKWDLNSYTCFSGNGYVQDFKMLEAKYPNSVFILNLRRLDEWIISVFKHGAREYIHGWISSKVNCMNLINARNKHYTDVLDYFKDKRDRLIMVNTDSDWIPYICSVLKFDNHDIVSQNISPDASSQENQNIINILNEIFTELSYTDSQRENILFDDQSIAEDYYCIYNNNIVLNTSLDEGPHIKAYMRALKHARETLGLKNKRIIELQNRELKNAFKTLHTTNPSIDPKKIDEDLKSIMKPIEGIEQDEPEPIVKEKVSITIPIYRKPTRTDMAVILVYFNACEYKKLAQNLSLTYQTLVRSQIPVFLVEHCFKDQVPLFPENGTNIFNTRSDSYMFYKENLINWLMPKIPEQYTKFYIMDCDVFFEKDTWYDDVSILLDTHDVLQPYERAIWLESDLKCIMFKSYSSSYNFVNNLKPVPDGHPGFAWAVRRDFFQPLGFFDLNVFHSGDSLFALSLFKMKLDRFFYSHILCNISYFNEYHSKLNIPRITYYSQTLYHLWHGSKTNRNYHNKYGDLHYIIGEIKTKEELLEINSYGIYEFNMQYREKLNTVILNYFKARDEDGI
jgi:hypothetical protein